jgi:hypothetical protein
MVLLWADGHFELRFSTNSDFRHIGVNFCGEAWYLRRRQVPHSDFGERRLQQGAIAHRQIGKRTERLRGIERLRVVLLSATIILLAVIAMQLGARLP